MDGCIHHFGDGLARVDGKTVVIFNHFKVRTKSIRCVSEQYNLYLHPRWTNKKADDWYSCAAKSRNDIGTWNTSVLDAYTGVTLTGSANTYVWGKSNHMTPDGEAVYLVETVRSDVYADFSNQPTGPVLEVRTLVNGLWKVLGSVPVRGRPKIFERIVEGNLGIGAYSFIGDLTLADRDGDGLLDVAIVDENEEKVWIGFDRSTLTFEVK